MRKCNENTKILEYLSYALLEDPAACAQPAPRIQSPACHCHGCRSGPPPCSVNLVGKHQRDHMAGFKPGLFFILYVGRIPPLCVVALSSVGVLVGVGRMLVSIGKWARAGLGAACLCNAHRVLYTLWVKRVLHFLFLHIIPCRNLATLYMLKEITSILTLYSLLPPLI